MVIRSEFVRIVGEIVSVNVDEAVNVDETGFFFFVLDVVGAGLSGFVQGSDPFL